MTHEIRIADLAEPVLSDLQRSRSAYGESQRTDLTVDAVLERARAATGLDDFGPDDFHERLGLWLSEMDEDEDAVGLARLVLFGNAVRYASNRLRIADLLRRHPEIHDVPIERPVIVVGLPRSGTTNLVNLLAADQRFRSMPLSESYEPVPDPTEPVGADGVDPRWSRCHRMWEAMRATVPHVAAMHPMEPDHIHEELELQLPDFASYNRNGSPGSQLAGDQSLSHDQTSHYRYMRTGLQILQWQRPAAVGARVPAAPGAARPADGDVPDAAVVVTHRDPVAVVAVDGHHDGVLGPHGLPAHRPEWYAEYWTDRVRRLLESLGPRPAPAPRRPHRGRVLRPLHGRRDGDLAAHLRRGRHGLHAGGPPRSRRTATPTPGAGQARSSTTCDGTSPSPPTTSAPVRLLLRPLRHQNRGHMTIQDQVDRLIDERPAGSS